MQIIKWFVTCTSIWKKRERNVKETSPWGQNKMVPHGGLHLHKRGKNTSSGNYKLYKDFYLSTCISLKDNQMAWNKNNIKHSCSYNTWTDEIHNNNIKKSQEKGMKVCCQSSHTSFKMVYCWKETVIKIHSISSVAQSCPTLCDPMNSSTPGLPVHHQLPEFTQTHVHRVGDAIQPSHSLWSPSPPALNLSQHQGLFKWVSSSPSGGQY